MEKECSLFTIVGVGMLLAVAGTQDTNQAKIVVLVEQPYPDDLPPHINDTSEIDIANTTLNLTTFTIDITNLNIIQLHALLCQHVRSGAILFLAATKSCDTLGYVSRALGEIAIPLVNLHDVCTDDVDVQPDVTNYWTPRQRMEYSLMDVFKETGWQNFIFIHDHNLGGADLDLAEPMMANNITALAYSIEEENMTRILDAVHHASITNIVVACSLHCTRQLFQIAISLDKGPKFQGLFTHRVQFLVITTHAQMAALQQYVEDIDHVVAVVPARRRQHLLQAIQTVRDTVVAGVEAYDPPTDDNVAPSTTPCGGDSSLAYFTRQILQSTFDEEPCRNCTEVEIYAAFYTSNYSREFQIVGEWTRDAYVTHAPVFPNIQYGFNQRHFRVGTNLWGPFVGVAENSTVGYEGLCIQLLIELSRNLNFTFDLSLPEDGGWGGEENGNWTGLVGMLQRQEANMVVAPLASNVDRERVMDFTEAFYLEYTAVLVRYTDINADKWRLYLQPFRWEAWLCFLLAIPVGAFFVWLVTRLTPYYPCHGEKACREAYSGLGSFYNALLSTFGAFFQQGSIWLPQAQSVRFIVGFWWMYCIVVMATYSGNLIAYLTVTKTELPFDSLEEMVANDDFTFGTMGGTVTEHLLSKARSGIEKELWDKIKQWSKQDSSILSTNQTEQIQRVLNEQYAYINDRTGFELQMSETCDVGIVNELFLPSEYSVGLQNNSYFLQEISLEVIKIKESGLINKLKAEYWPKQSFCSTGMQTEAKAVSLNDVQGAYYAMAILLGLAVVSLLSEKVIQYSRGRVARARRKSTGHSGGYMDEVPNGHAGYQYSNYFDFSPGESHEMRSVRSQSVAQHSNGSAVTSNGYTHGEVSNGSVLTGNIWTYESIRGDAYTYNNIAKNVA